MKYLICLAVCITVFKAGAQSSALPVADSLYAVGNYTKAIDLYDKIQDKDAKVFLQIARSYKGIGNNSKAITAYKNSLEKNEDQPIAAIEYGRLLIANRRFPVADSVFSGLTKKYPNNPEYFYQWGRALKALQSGKKDTIVLGNASKRIKYEDAFAKAVSLDSTHQKAIFQLALHHLKLRDYPLVERLCKKGLTTEPDNVEIANIFAQNFYNRGFYSEAVDAFERLLELGVSNEFVHEKLGYSYYQESMYELAIEQYNILLGYDDEDYGIHLILTKLYNFIKDFKKAEFHGKQALYFKDLPLDDVHMTRGATYRLHKKWPEAIEQFQAAIKENSDRGDAYHNIAICADNFYEDKTEVLKLYERFITKFKDHKRYKYFARIAEERAKILKKEIFLAEEDKN